MTAAITRVKTYVLASYLWRISHNFKHLRFGYAHLNTLTWPSS